MSYKRAMDGGSLFKFETQLLAKSLGSLALEEYKKTDLMWSISSVLRFTFWVVFHIPLENFTPSDTYLIKRYGFERHKQISFCTNVVSPFREEQIEKLIFNTNKVILGKQQSIVLTTKEREGFRTSGERITRRAFHFWSEDMLGGNSRKQLGRRDRCRKRKIWDDWKKCSVISSGDMDGVEYAQTFFAFCISCSPWFSHLQSDFQILCIGLTPLGTLMWEFLYSFCSFFIIDILFRPLQCLASG